MIYTSNGIESAQASIREVTAHPSVQAARDGISSYFNFFNDERPHTALGVQTPASFYDGLRGKAA